MSTCAAGKCTAPTGKRRIVLIDPTGRDQPQDLLCDKHTDAVLPCLFETYPEGDPAYRVEVLA